jgi:hypothetical protein
MVGQKKVKLQRGGHRVIDWCASVLSCGTGERPRPALEAGRSESENSGQWRSSDQNR